MSQLATLPPLRAFPAGFLEGQGAKQQQQQQQQQKAGPMIKAMAGSIGGIVEAHALQPMDTIKTRMQLNPALYPGILSAGSTIARQEGVRALWKGLTPFATHLCLKYALRFGTNAGFQSLLADEYGKLNDTRRVLAGLGAGVTEALIIVTPFEFIKIRLQSQVGLDKAQLKYKGPIDAAVQTVRSEGVLAMWSGATPTVYRNGVNQATMFVCKSKLDELLFDKREGDGKKLAVWQSMSGGFLATCPGIILTNPFDIVKTRLQAQEKTAAAGGPKYRGLIHAMVLIMREEGVGRLYRGLLPRLLRVPPGMAITWAVTDQIVDAVENQS